MFGPALQTQHYRLPYICKRGGSGVFPLGLHCGQGGLCPIAGTAPSSAEHSFMGESSSGPWKSPKSTE